MADKKRTTGTLAMSDLPIGYKGKIVSLESTGTERRRMLDLGLICGTIIEALHKSPSGDPTAFYVRGTVIALREEDTKKILLSSLI